MLTIYCASKYLRLLTTLEPLQDPPAGADGQSHRGECGVAGLAGLHHRTGANEEVVHPPHLAVTVHHTSAIIPLPHSCCALYTE